MCPGRGGAPFWGAAKGQIFWGVEIDRSPKMVPKRGWLYGCRSPPGPQKIPSLDDKVTHRVNNARQLALKLIANVTFGSPSSHPRTFRAAVIQMPPGATPECCGAASDTGHARPLNVGHPNTPFDTIFLLSAAIDSGPRLRGHCPCCRSPSPPDTRPPPPRGACRARTWRTPLCCSGGTRWSAASAS